VFRHDFLIDNNHELDYFIPRAYQTEEKMKKLIYVLSSVIILNAASVLAAGPFENFSGHYTVTSDKCFTGEVVQVDTGTLKEIPCSLSLTGITVSPNGEDWTLTEEYGESGSSPFPIFESRVEYPNGSTVIAEIAGSSKPAEAHWIYNTKFYGVDEAVTSETRERSLIDLGDKVLFFYLEKHTDMSSGHKVVDQMIRMSELQKAK
jgi:hypothetical protein